MPDEYIGMPHSEWLITEAAALRDEALNTTDSNRYIDLRNGALAAGQGAVKACFIESLKELHPGVEFPSFDEGETMLEYIQRLENLIKAEE